MRTAIIALAVCLGVSYGKERPIDPLADQLAFYQNFEATLNPQQKAHFEQLKKAAEAREWETLRSEADKLQLKYVAEFGREYKFSDRSLERLRTQVRAMKVFLEERKQARILDQSAEIKKQQDAEAEEWRLEQQRQFKLRQLQTELDDANRKLDKARR